MSRKNTTSITTAEENPAESRDRREAQYMITMAIRMVCLLLMIVVTPYSWYTVVFLLGAALLPYVAVINANNGSRKASKAKAPEAAVEQHAPSDAAASDSPETIILLEPETEEQS